ncbi:TraX protein [compost metagenome]
MLKFIALIAMFIDHIGHVFFPTMDVFKIIGRVSLPLFAWSIAKGVEYTSDIKKYAIRVLGLAVVSQFPYAVLFKNNSLNVCFTLFIGILIIQLLESKINFLVKYMLAFSCLLLSDFLNFDYGIYGAITIIICFYFHNKLHWLMIFQTLITLLSLEVYNFSTLQLYSLLSLLLIIFFKNTDFRIHKFVFYIAFPSHMIILVFIKNLF